MFAFFVQKKNVFFCTSMNYIIEFYKLKKNYILFYSIKFRLKNYFLQEINKTKKAQNKLEARSRQFKYFKK